MIKSIDARGKVYFAFFIHLHIVIIRENKIAKLSLKVEKCSSC